MRITRLGGLDYRLKFGGTISSADKIECVFEADGAIPACVVAMHDTANPLGTLVVVADVANDHAACGIYEGFGGSGSASATVGAPSGSRDAVDGDIILITTYGNAKVILDATSSERGPLKVVGAGHLNNTVAAVAEGLKPAFTALQAESGSEARAVFVACM